MEGQGRQGRSHNEACVCPTVGRGGWGGAGWRGTAGRYCAVGLRVGVEGAAFSPPLRIVFHVFLDSCFCSNFKDRFVKYYGIYYIYGLGARSELSPHLAPRTSRHTHTHTRPPPHVPPRKPPRPPPYTHAPTHAPRTAPHWGRCALRLTARSAQGAGASQSCDGACPPWRRRRGAPPRRRWWGRHRES